MARKRERWHRHQHKLDPRRLVFIDETWAKTNMTRTHGRSLRGDRLVAKVPHGRWRTLTFIAALRHDRITAPIVFDQPINGETFTAYVEQALLPTLTPGDVVILDNLGSHKGKAEVRVIALVGQQHFGGGHGAQQGGGPRVVTDLPCREKQASRSSIAVANRMQL